jgi:hypothetical protein
MRRELHGKPRHRSEDITWIPQIQCENVKLTEEAKEVIPTEGLDEQRCTMQSATINFLTNPYNRQ